MNAHSICCPHFKFSGARWHKKVDKAVEVVRWVVKWIRQSPSRIHKFTEFAKVANPGITKHLKRDVPTRCNSTYHMLEIAQAYEKTFERYDLEEFDFRYEIEKADWIRGSISDTIDYEKDWEENQQIDKDEVVKVQEERVGARRRVYL
ncbi:unnamed protein product [Lactuca virosa]|uniref:Uncharacterized protein n=1 Tax=Lactuca virosa TaxID=75947 RepID=A0AAU9LY15_9ASTR|nr:unnamed protein product [Lactuca virosa]